MPNTRPKIAFVIDNLGFGGAQKQLAILTGALLETIEPRVYCLSTLNHPFGRKIRDMGIPVTEFERRSHLDFGRLGPLRKALLSDRIDVVHGFLDAANIYSFFAARGARLPIVLSLRNERFRFRGIRARVLCHALRKADRVVVNSASGRCYLTSSVGVHPDNVFFVPNAISMESFPTGGTTDRPAGPPVFGFVGRLAPQKRVDLLIESFALISEKSPDARLVIIGDGAESARLASLIQKRGLEDAVAMEGAIEDASHQMAGFTCLVLPSEFEGVPNAALEALAAGIPVVASAAGDVEKIVINGRTGKILEEHTPAALASALEDVVENASLRRQVQLDGPRIVEDNFSVDAAAEALRKVYKSLTGGP
jgi:glycosyltransferase involved in cell wall biosynthesis